MQRGNRKLITPAAYAKLRGLNRSTVSRQIHEQKIPTIGGLVDPEIADLAREKNLDQGKCLDEATRKAQRGAAKRAAVPAVPSLAMPNGALLACTRAEQEAEFRRGVAWMAHSVCTSARRVWPPFVMEHWPDMPRSGQIGLMAVLCERLELWTATAALPEFDWAGLFGPDAAAAAGEYGRLGREWPAAGRIDLACGPDGTPGAAWMEGARACARAVCIAARRMLPRLIEREVFEPGEDRFSTVHLVALLMSLIEGWMGGYVMSEWLPPIEWQMVFAAGAPEADQEYRALRQGWAA